MATVEEPLTTRPLGLPEAANLSGREDAVSN